MTQHMINTHLIGPDLINMHLIELGLPQHVGKAFSFSLEALKEEFGTIEALPKPDYEHAVWRDTHTANFMVVRPDRFGSPWPGCKGMERVR